MIDVLSLSRIVGAFTLQKGLEYSRRGAVLDLEVTEDPMRISGRVQGSTSTPYQVGRRRQHQRPDRPRSDRYLFVPRPDELASTWWPWSSMGCPPEVTNRWR